MFLYLQSHRILKLEGICLQMKNKMLKEDILLIQGHPVNQLENHGIVIQLPYPTRLSKMCLAGKEVLKYSIGFSNHRKRM